MHPQHTHMNATLIQLIIAAVIFICIVGLIRETVQMLLDPRDYAHSWFQNSVEVVIYILAIVFALNFSQCPWRDAYKEKWQYRAGIIAVLGCW